MSSKFTFLPATTYPRTRSSLDFTFRFYCQNNILSSVPSRVSMSQRRSRRPATFGNDDPVPPAPAQNCVQCAELRGHITVLENLHAARLKELGDSAEAKGRERNWHAERVGLQARIKALEDAADAQFRAHVKVLRDLGLHDLAQAAAAPMAITSTLATTERFRNNTAANYAAGSGSSRSGKNSTGGARSATKKPPGIAKGSIVTAPAPKRRKHDSSALTPGSPLSPLSDAPVSVPPRRSHKASNPSKPRKSGPPALAMLATRTRLSASTRPRARRNTDAFGARLPEVLMGRDEYEFELPECVLFGGEEDEDVPEVVVRDEYVPELLVGELADGKGRREESEEGEDEEGTDECSLLILTLRGGCAAIRNSTLEVIHSVDCLDLLRTLMWDINAFSSFGHTIEVVRNWTLNRPSRLSVRIADFAKMTIASSICNTWVWRAICMIPHGWIALMTQSIPFLKQVQEAPKPTSATLVYFLWEISCNLEAFKRLPDEIDGEMPDPFVIPDLSVLQELSYVTAFIQDDELWDI
ncbi:hypothetical protein C8J57DRAFT_1717180 [Mycena rebaudengoi]|nr:hypothetical protein C8J57DRAFT_1717180 [Mycena rebaudengoi]